MSHFMQYKKPTSGELDPQSHVMCTTRHQLVEDQEIFEDEEKRPVGGEETLVIWRRDC